ncbi:hypothetical protein SAMN04489867_0583 [Pedococcus dokdonensis]|uniref:Uncharacterized protein n=1 Tax=Pedococcus dokdonensis TaxID=443156 RepID=A0A1H0ME56_9MICO|nr:hypothetical protein SAMN04489867_0583 [Pedococcus dokdonensis]
MPGRASLKRHGWKRHGLRRHSPREFDPVALGRLETLAWASYYRREWVPALRGFVGMISQGFGLGPRLTVVAAWHVLRANQAWAPVPNNDPDAARASMLRFYRLVRSHSDLVFDPVTASELEVEWWRLHRAHQRDDAATRAQLEQALIDLYSHVYAAPPESMHEAARWRAEAMDLSDEWVDAGCDLDDARLSAERRALVASYAALLDAVGNGLGSWRRGTPPQHDETPD